MHEMPEQKNCPGIILKLFFRNYLNNRSLVSKVYAVQLFRFKRINILR